MKKVILVLLILLLAVSVAHAKDRWEQMDENEKWIYYLDTQTFRYDKDFIDCWIKIYIKESNGYWLNRYNIDRKTRQFMINEVFEFDKNGVSTNSWNEKAKGWRSAPPGTAQEYNIDYSIEYAKNMEKKYKF